MGNIGPAVGFDSMDQAQTVISVWRRQTTDVFFKILEGMGNKRYTL